MTPLSGAPPYGGHVSLSGGVEDVLAEPWPAHSLDTNKALLMPQGVTSRKSCGLSLCPQGAHQRFLLSKELFWTALKGRLRVLPRTRKGSARTPWVPPPQGETLLERKDGKKKKRDGFRFVSFDSNYHDDVVLVRRGFHLQLLCKLTIHYHGEIMPKSKTNTAQNTNEISTEEEGGEYYDAFENEDVVLYSVNPSHGWANVPKVAKTLYTFHVYADEAGQFDRDDFDQENRFDEPGQRPNSTRRNVPSFAIKVFAINPRVNPEDPKSPQQEEHTPGLLQGQKLKISGVVDIEKGKLRPGWDGPQGDKPHQQFATVWLHGASRGSLRFQITQWAQQTQRRPSVPTF
jgi:hypothetical protein